jgi:uncharacterized protein (DUF2384 family)
MTAAQTADAVGTSVLLPGDDQSALRAFFEIAEAWKLTTDDQLKLLGSPPRSSFFKLKKDGGQLNRDQLERISHIINIYKCLRILFTDQEAADRWLAQPNKAPFLQGRSALEFMVHDGYLSDIFQVRRYLDAQRG